MRCKSCNQYMVLSNKSSREKFFECKHCEFKNYTNIIQKELHETAVEKGFWENSPDFLNRLMLIVSELGEAAEAYRKDDQENMREELADTVIRIMDLAENMGFSLAEEILKKAAFNKTRPYLHGKKC